MESLVEISREGAVARLTLARPEKFNCLSMALFQAMESALENFEDDGEVAALIIDAQGKNFCTGAQLDEVEHVLADETQLREFLSLGHRVLDRLEDSPLVVCAAIEGLCLAGGLELMLACDIVFAGRGARFGDQHGQFGLIPGWGGSQRLPAVIGPRRALDLLLGVRWIDAETALSWGLVNYVVDDGDTQAAALAYAQTVATRSRGSMRLMKQLARSAQKTDLQVGKSAEIEAARAALLSNDVREGLSAFKQKRRPQFGAVRS